MRPPYLSIAFLLLILGNGCAQTPPRVVAQTRLPATAPSVAAPAPAAAARPPTPVPDQEPEVAAEVNEILRQYGAGDIAPQRLSERARASLTAAAARQEAARLRALGQLQSLQLLERRTDGENRLYRYRALYDQGAVLVDITFGKGSRIGHLQLTPE